MMSLLMSCLVRGRLGRCIRGSFVDRSRTPRYRPYSDKPLESQSQSNCSNVSVDLVSFKLHNVIKSKYTYMYDQPIISFWITVAIIYS